MATKARILVVDDNKRTVRAIQRILERRGYEILTAFDGVAGLYVAQKEKPDLIILDIMMPKADGYQVCRILQRDPDTAGIAVLILTGTSGRIDGARSLIKRSIREREDGFDAGAVEFMTKPIRTKELVERVKTLLWISGIQS